MPARSQHKPLCFGASSDALGPPSSPAENKAAHLLSPKGYNSLKETQCKMQMARCYLHANLLNNNVHFSSLLSLPMASIACYTQSTRSITTGNVCYRKETQRALRVLDRNVRICATLQQPARSSGAALHTSACAPSSAQARTNPLPQPLEISLPTVSASLRCQRQTVPVVWQGFSPTYCPHQWFPLKFWHWCRNSALTLTTNKRRGLPASGFFLLPSFWPSKPTPFFWQGKAGTSGELKAALKDHTGCWQR